MVVEFVFDLLQPCWITAQCNSALVVAVQVVHHQLLEVGCVAQAGAHPGREGCPGTGEQGQPSVERQLAGASSLKP